MMIFEKFSLSIWFPCYATILRMWYHGPAVTRLIICQGSYFPERNFIYVSERQIFSVAWYFLLLFNFGLYGLKSTDIGCIKCELNKLARSLCLSVLVVNLRFNLSISITFWIGHLLLKLTLSRKCPLFYAYLHFVYSQEKIKHLDLKGGNNRKTEVAT